GTSNTASRVLVFYALPVGQGTGFNTTPKVVVSTTALKTPIAATGGAATGGYGCMPTSGLISRGATVLLPGDFNNDKRLDFILASASETSIYYYYQNSDGTFSQGTTIAFSPGGALLGYTGDIDRDGNLDFMIVRSGNDCGGLPGQSFLFVNAGNGSFTMRQTVLSGIGAAAQFAAVTDVNGDKTLDLLFGKLSGTGSYILYKNTPSTAVFAVNGSVISKSISSSLDPSTKGVVGVTLNTYTKSLPANTSISLYVTNDGGAHWELLSASELTGSEHTFTNFGADFRWKAALWTQPQTLSGGNTAYASGSTLSPTLIALSFTYKTVDRRTYSRSTLAQGKFTSGSNTYDYLYSAAFQYPGFQAKLYAYNIGALAAGGAGSGLQRVDNLVPLAWEAGSLLAAKSASSRTLYTAYPTGYLPSAPPSAFTHQVSRMRFSVGEINAPTTSPTLQSLMGLTDTEKVNTMNFLLGGMNDPNSWKFFDTGHSSPVFVGTPTGDANYLGAGYAGFVTTNSSRTPIVLQGSNDGMLHAFNALTGAEEWGYIPYNLLAKMKTQRAVDPNTGAYSYAHTTYVDGSIRVTDVYSGGAWHTVAVVGQAQGQGLSGNNFYFALDITDTTNPQPLWEFTDPWTASAPICDGIPTYQSCTQACSATANCVGGASPGNSYFYLTAAGSPKSGGVGGFIEAEHYDTLTASRSPNPNATWRFPVTVNATALADGSAPASPNNYLQAISTATAD
ncbi:MAG TPA: PilC/PilY family type IV pilus protein, partial [Myxococcota bacterium]|nr:PilC/PilY family type IV pilus protein [Myxococcota bacterium]